MFSTIKENESSVPQTSTWGNFKQYAKCGRVPLVYDNSTKSDVPINSFYKSVNRINDVIGPAKNVLFGVQYSMYTDIGGAIKPTVFALTNTVLQSLYLAFAYFSYLPAKGLSKATDKFDLKHKTKFVSYSNTLSHKAQEHSKGTAEFVNKILSYVFTSVIWILALPITPIIWLFDKCTSSKVSEMEKPEQVKANDTEISNALLGN